MKHAPRRPKKFADCTNPFLSFTCAAVTLDLSTTNRPSRGVKKLTTFSGSPARLSTATGREGCKIQAQKPSEFGWPAVAFSAATGRVCWLRSIDLKLNECKEEKNDDNEKKKKYKKIAGDRWSGFGRQGRRNTVYRAKSDRARDSFVNRQTLAQWLFLVPRFRAPASLIRPVSMLRTAAAGRYEDRWITARYCVAQYRVHRDVQARRLSW